MANKTLKTFVAINSAPGGFDIELELTPEQSVTLLRHMAAGDPTYISLKTPGNGHKPAENPAAYAQ